MSLLQIEWGVVGIKAAQLLLSLSILVILHEFGHFITAKWFGCRVEKFYLFFDPWFSLFKRKIGETEYGIGWLPLGGYVKISGMIDESMDKEAMKEPPKDWEFRSKPAWQRLIIMLGGIIVNVLLAILIYSMVLFFWGETKIPMKSLKYGIAFQDSLLYKIGFQQGDQLLTVDDKPVTYYNDATYKVFTGRKAVVQRGNEQVQLSFPESLIGDLIENKKKGAMIIPRIPAIVGEFGPEPSAFKDAGAKEGDIVKAINGHPITFYDEIRSTLLGIKPDSINMTVCWIKNFTVRVQPFLSEVDIQVLRNGVETNLRSKVMEDNRLGVPFVSNFDKLDSMQVIKKEHVSFSFFQAFPAGLKLTGDKLMSYIDQFRLIFNTKTGAYKGLGGFKAMANAFPSVWDWESFWSMTALLSIILAFMNLLPIPALDGGHVMFTLYEMVTRRKPNEKLMEYAQIAGMILLLGLMLLANANDWLGWGR